MLFRVPEPRKFLSPRSIATDCCDQTSPKEFRSPISSISADPGCSRERLLRRASRRLASETPPNRATQPGPPMPGLCTGVGHRSRSPAQAGTRRASRLDWRPPWTLRHLREDIHIPSTVLSALTRITAYRRAARHCSGVLRSSAHGRRHYPSSRTLIVCPIRPQCGAGSSGLDCFQLALSFLNLTVIRVAHWLARGHQSVDHAGPPAWITPPLQLLWPLRL